MLRKSVSCIVLLFFASVFLFAGGQGESSGEETIELKYQVWITPNLTRAFYDEIAAAFVEEHPNVEIEIIEVSATASSGASDFIRNRIAAGDVPDVMSNLGDIAAFADAGHLWPMPLDDSDIAVVKNIESAMYNGNVYSLPYNVQPQSVIYYNKSLWAEAGLTEDDIPYTTDEFDAVCAQIKDAGLTPIITGGEWVPLVLFEYFVGPEITKNYPEFWTDVYAGRKKWTDPDIVQMLEILDGYVKKGYFNEGALSIGYAQLEQEFLSGKAVMYPMGSWFTAAEANADKDFEVGCFAAPTLDGEVNMLRSGGYGASPVVSADSDDPEMAFELVKFIVLDPYFGAKFIQVDGLFSNLDPPLTYDMTPLQEQLADVTANADYSRSMISHVLGDAAPPGVGDFFTDAGEAILAQSYSSLEDLLKQIQDFVDETR